MSGYRQAGFVRLPTQLVEQIVQSLEAPKVTPTEEQAGEEEAPPVHGEVIDKIKRIGKLQGYIAEKEYPMDIGRLDVVWRKVERAVPMYVFEVHIGGDIYHALAKLKHAYDIWNSRIYLVAGLRHQDRAEELLGGTFHEIGSQLVFIQIEKVEQLLRLKRGVRELEEELGLHP